MRPVAVVNLCLGALELMRLTQQEARASQNVVARLQRSFAKMQPKRTRQLAGKHLNLRA